MNKPIKGISRARLAVGVLAVAATVASGVGLAAVGVEAKTVKKIPIVKIAPPKTATGYYVTPGYRTPGYATPGYVTPGYNKPVYVTPGYTTPGYKTPGYSGMLPAVSLSALNAREKVAPATDATVSGIYTAARAMNANPTVNVDKGLTKVTPPATTYCVSGSLIKSVSGTAVFYCGHDGKRYLFPNAATYATWYNTYNGITGVSDLRLNSIAIGGIVTYRPGARLVKIATDSKIYAVARGGVLRLVPSDAVAKSIYGAAWKQKVDVVPDNIFTNYTIGLPISNR
jgi:hypothetical protein